jgi:hypothetical protein
MAAMITALLLTRQESERDWYRCFRAFHGPVEIRTISELLARIDALCGIRLSARS